MEMMTNEDKLGKPNFWSLAIWRCCNTHWNIQFRVGRNSKCMWINVGDWPSDIKQYITKCMKSAKTFFHHCVPLVRSSPGCQGRPSDLSNRTLHKGEAWLFPYTTVNVSFFYTKKIQLTWSLSIWFRHHSLLIKCHWDSQSLTDRMWSSAHSCHVRHVGLSAAIAFTCLSCRLKSSLLTAIHYHNERLQMTFKSLTHCSTINRVNTFNLHWPGGSSTRHLIWALFRFVGTGLVTLNLTSVKQVTSVTCVKLFESQV